MGQYLISGVNIEDLAETAKTSDIRNASGFSTCKYHFNGETYTASTERKFIWDFDGYIYSGDCGITNKFLRCGEVSFKVSRKGCRPMPNRRWQTTSAGSFYINKYPDGEAWVSTSTYSKTGTKISTTAEDLQYVMVLSISPGAGGGGSSGTVSGGGGGGGALAYLCHKLVDNCILRLYVGKGGAGGAGNAKGGSGGNNQVALFRTSDWANSGVTCYNFGHAVGGASGGTGGAGGAGGSDFDDQSTNQYIEIVQEVNGPRGGTKGSSGSGTSDRDLKAYNPENCTLNVGMGVGGAGNLGGGGAGGWFYGHAGGKGGEAYENGGAGQMCAGGGGGAFVLFSSRTGGKGGDGYTAVYY